MPSKMLSCSDCGKEWEYTQEEQEYIEQKQFTPPKRCKDCRWKKKQRNEQK